MRTYRCAICRSRSIFIQNSGRAAYTAPGTAVNASRRSFAAVQDTRSGFRQTALPLGRDQGASDNRPRSTYLRTSSAGVLPFRFALTKARPTGCKVICAPRSTCLRTSSACPNAPLPLRRVHRAASFAPPVIDFAAGLARRVRRTDALRRLRSTLLRILSAGHGPPRPAMAPDRPAACCPHAPAPAKARPANFRLAANAID